MSRFLTLKFQRDKEKEIKEQSSVKKRSNRMSREKSKGQGKGLGRGTLGKKKDLDPLYEDFRGKFHRSYFAKVKKQTGENITEWKLVKNRMDINSVGEGRT